MIKNIKNDGFTLLDVLIGMTILTIAIVSATSLLLSLMNSNKTVVNSLQAYYLAQEGLEAALNIRDSNWMHNLDWKGESSFLGKFEEGDYAVFVKEEGWGSSLEGQKIDDMNALTAKPWNLDSLDVDTQLEKARLCKTDSGLFGDCSSGEQTDFYRYLTVYPYCEEQGAEESANQLCDNAIIVKSTVKWGQNQEKQLVLEKVLTNWKGGAI